MERGASNRGSPVGFAFGAAAVVFALFLLAAGCAPQRESSQDAEVLLEELAVAAPGSMSGYSREEFPHWSPAEDYGWDPPQESCNAREAALIRDGEDVAVGSGCRVGSGEWTDPYTGRTYTDPKEIDIDHVVPLAEAWRSGAAGWGQEERESYANDPDVLLAVEDDANQEKSDKGPEEWRPPVAGFHCEYARRWVGIKAKYSLSVDEEERAALREMLAECPMA